MGADRISFEVRIRHELAVGAGEPRRTGARADETCARKLDLRGDVLQIVDFIALYRRNKVRRATLKPIVHWYQ